MRPIRCYAHSGAVFTERSLQGPLLSDMMVIWGDDNVRTDLELRIRETWCQGILKLNGCKRAATPDNVPRE